ncbi:MAG: FecR domain-containing protein [Pseudomonadota bacterium]
MATTDITHIAKQASLPEPIVEQALQWLVLSWSEDQPTWEEPLQQWRTADPQHERAWQHVSVLDNRLTGVHGELAAKTIRGADKQISRRNILFAAGLLAAGGLALPLLKDGQLLKKQLADTHTRVGETRLIHLSDGTRLHVNTETQLNIHFDGTERRVELLSGEIMVTTATDPLKIKLGAARPFLVVTADMIVRPIGTQFVVRATNQYKRVSVMEGAVNLLVPAQSGSPRVVRAGQAVQETNAGLQPDRVTPNDMAWTRGQLVAEQMPLSDFLSELARYRPGVLRWTDSTAALKVTGTFSLEDTDHTLHILTSILPIQVSQATRYWVTIDTIETSNQ